METRHCIENAVFKISFPSEEAALAQQQEFEQFVKTRLLQVVEDVFNEVSQSDSVLWFDILEIDLGEISQAFFYEDFEEKLEQELRQCLSAEIVAIQHNPNAAGRKITLRQSELEILCNFLKTGQLPWNASSNSNKDIEALATKVFKENRAELLQHLSDSSERADMVSRLAKQFTQDHLSELTIHALNVGMELRTVIDELCNLSARSFGISGDNFITRIWADLLLFALSGKSRTASPQQVLLEVAASIAAFLPQHRSLVLKQLLQHARSQGNHNQLYQLLRTVTLNASEALSNHTDISLQDEFNLSGIDEGGNAARYRSRLVEAMKSGSVRNLKSIWFQILARHPDLLKSITLRLGQSAQVRHVIAHKFEENMIRDILSVLEPTHQEFINRVLSEPSLLAQGERELVTEASNAKKWMWEFTLTYLIVDRGSQFNRKAYIASLLWQTAAHLGVGILELYESFISILQSTPPGDQLRDELLDILQWLKTGLPSGMQRQIQAEGLTPLPGDARAGESASPLDFSLTSAHDMEQRQPSYEIQAALRQALEKAKVDGLKMLWQELLENYSPWFTETLRREGQRAIVRRNLAVGFADTMLRDVVMQIEPSEAEHIYETVTGGYLNSGLQTYQKCSPAAAKTLTWEFTLTYLLVERGNLFNKNSYLASLVKKMANRQNQSVKNVLSAMTLTLEAEGSVNSKAAEILSMIRELYDYLIDDVNSVSLSKAHAQSKGEALRGVMSHDLMESKLGRRRASETTIELEQLELIRAYLLYEKLVGMVASAERIPPNLNYQVVRLLHELIENYPWKLHRFNQEVNAGRLPFSAMLEKLPKALQKKLVLTFFNSFTAKYEFGVVEFEENLEILAKKSGAVGPSYHTLFNRLIGNQIRSLDALFAPEESITRHNYANEKFLLNRIGQRPSDRSLSSASELADEKSQKETARRTPMQTRHGSELYELGTQRRESTPPLSMSGNTVELIKAFLLGHLLIKEHELDSVANTIELMLSSHPSKLQSLLADSLLDKASVGRLVEILPESMLVKIMLLLRPADHFQVVLYADLLTMACVEHTKTLNIEPRLLHRLKWQFILSYLVIDRQIFNEVAFVREFFGYLKQHSSKEARKEFQQQLSDGVMAISSRGTHAACVRIVMILDNSVNDEPVSAKPVQGKAEKIFHQKASQQTQARRRNMAETKAGAEPEAESKQAGHNLGFEENNAELEILEEVYIGNAGLVLLGPYLQRYFDTLKLTAGREFIDSLSAERGVHMLQYMLDGSTNSPEHLLVLNKILCGVKTRVPIARSIDITEQEKTLSETLLRGVIANWPKLKNTSIKGLRESFLQREAQLQRHEDSWKLLVQTKAFDMLLDDLPWGYSTIKLPWMDMAIYVDWR